MEAGISQEERQTIDLALTKNPTLAKLVLAMVEAAETLNLSSKSDGALSNTSATLPEVPTCIAGRIETVKGYQTEDTYQAAVGSIRVKGQQLDTLLSEGSFDLSRADQTAYAESLGFRFATREEHRVYVDSLLAKEDAGTINDAEKNALETYRKRYVRDDQGGLDVDGRRVFARVARWRVGFPSFGALFVRLSAESN
jgi:hypothetical protein